MHMDGASNSKGSGLGVVLATPDDTIIEQSYSLGFQANNNEVEYEALIAGLKMAEILGVRNLEVRCDSLLVVSQVNGDFACKDSRMEAYTHLVSRLKKKFDHCSFKQVPWSENNHADSLANLASAVEWQARREVPMDYIAKPSISIGREEALRLNISPGWR